MNKPIIVTSLCIALVATSAVASWRDWMDEILDSPILESASPLTESEIVAGLRDALGQASQVAVSRLGKIDGFWKNPRVKLPLPGIVSSAQPFLEGIGQGHQVDSFHQSMNRAAELAVPEGLQILQKAVTGMTFNDAQGILNGPPDAATRFFERSSRGELDQRFQPIIGSALNKVGVTAQYEQLLASARPALAMVGRDPESLQGYTTGKALDGLFVSLADEEGRIRSDPAARSTEILKKVFSKQN